MAAYLCFVLLSMIALSLGSSDFNSPDGPGEDGEQPPSTIASSPIEPPAKSRRMAIDNTRSGLQGIPPSAGAGPSHSRGESDASQQQFSGLQGMPPSAGAGPSHSRIEADASEPRFPAQGSELWQYLLAKLLCPLTVDRAIKWEFYQPRGQWYLFSIRSLVLLRNDWNMHHASTAAVDNAQLLAGLKQLVQEGVLHDYSVLRAKRNTYAFDGANPAFKEQYDTESMRDECAVCGWSHVKCLRPFLQYLPRIVDAPVSQQLWQFIVDMLLCPTTQNVVAWDTVHRVYYTYQFVILDWTQFLDRWNLHHVAITHDELLEHIASHTDPNELLFVVREAGENTFAFNEYNHEFQVYYNHQDTHDECPICKKSHKKLDRE